jgi:hypothetical protein
MRRRRSVALSLAVVFCTCASTASLGCGDDDCDARKYCEGKTDKILSGTKIVPVCGAETEKDGTRYKWRTDQGTCTCTLDQSLAGSFWRNCKFE